jgi:RHS repeat-associated protein
VFELGKVGGGSEVLVSAQPVPLNEWTFLSATYDGTSMRIFLNTSSAGSRSVSIPLLPNSLPVSLGAEIDNNRRLVSGTFFRGSIDEPRLHNRAWSSNDILEAFNEFNNALFYAYDAAGNQIQKTAGDVVINYRYNADGRLTQIQENGSTMATFLYDSEGDRIKKISTVNNQALTTLYIGKIFEIRPPSSELPGGAQVDHIFAGSQLICDVISASSGESAVYIHPDHLGSASLVTDAQGNLVQDLAYQPFGEIAVSNGNSPLHHKYTGQEHDSETGLYFYNARYYDPHLGRFITADSIVPSAGDPQSLNRYAYVRNNPIIYDDPSGHKFSLKNLGWILLMPYAPSLSYNGLQGNINNSSDFKHYAYQAAVWNAGIAMAGVGIAAITPGTAVNTFVQGIFPGTWDVQATMWLEKADNVVASIGTNGWSVLGWGSVSYGGYTISYNLRQIEVESANDNQNTNQILLAMDLTYNNIEGSLIITNGEGLEIGTFPAANNAQIESIGPWPEGTYDFSYHNSHATDSQNSALGSNGIYVFNRPGCNGCGVHSGRAEIKDRRGRIGPQHATKGCIRTTDEATGLIKRQIQQGEFLKKLEVIR